MDALALYRAGQLKPAIDALGVELKKQPLDTRRRTFLFELLCFAGEYDRAAKQLDVLSDASAEAAAGAMLYRSALHAERTRHAPEHDPCHRNRASGRLLRLPLASSPR